jgi:hypothetical protein
MHCGAVVRVARTPLQTLSAFDGIIEGGQKGSAILYLEHVRAVNRSHFT